MANIILKDKNGTDITHMGIDYLCMRTLEGGLVRFNEGDIRVISVEELPSENIKEDAIYKVSATDEDGNAKVVFCTYVDGEWTEYKVGKDPVFENLEITENGTYTPAEGVDGWNEVTVNVESNPVLTELVVTENGVYDEPVIGGGTVEIAVGKTVTFKKNIPDVPPQNSGGKNLHFYNESGGWSWIIHAVGNYSYVILGEGDYVGGFPMSTYEYVTESVALSGEDPFSGITTAGWHKVDYKAEDMTISPCDPPSITIQDGKPMTGTTNIEMLTLLADFLFEAPSAPADGWNKVTVNVAGDIIDVDELPTENIEDGKIYRVTTENPPSIYIVTTEMGVLDYAYFATQMGGTLNLYVVDELPETMAPGMDNSSREFNMYIIKSTGVAYSSDDGTSASATSAGISFGVPDKGWVDSIDGLDGTNPDNLGIYTVRGSSSATYGIPDEANNKTVMEHNGSEWVECGAGSGSGGGLIEVTELPTENIDPNAIYKVADTGEMYMYGTTARLMVRAINDDTDTVVDFVEQGLLPVHDIHYLIVDEMPSIAYTIFAQNGIGVMYILRETGEPWFMFDGQIANFADAFNSSGDMPWLGMTSNASAETEPGVYTEMVSGWNKIRVFTESVKSA